MLLGAAFFSADLAGKAIGGVTVFLGFVSLLAFAGCLGGGILVRLLAGFGIRQVVKLIPVYGQTAGAAAF